MSQVKACRECGRVSVLPGGHDQAPGGVGVRAVTNERTGRITSGYAGLSTCGRIWLCPVCNSKVMAKRAMELAHVLLWADRAGYTVLWGMLTCWHTGADRLRRLIDVQRDAWRYVVSSKAWRSLKGVRVGYVRASELTVGSNGWHPHFHPLVILELEDDLVSTKAEKAKHIGDLIVELWMEGVSRAGGKALPVAQNLSPVDWDQWEEIIPQYVTKATYKPLPQEKLALESVWSQSKTGRGRVAETVAHWGLLDGAGAGLTEDVFRWWELEEATTGHRMMTWSRTIRKLSGLGVEESDEEVAGKELGDVEDTICYITAEGWRRVRDRPALQGLILDTLEEGGWVALRALLDDHEVDYMGFDGLASDGSQRVAGVTQKVEKLRPTVGLERTRGIAWVETEVLSGALRLEDGTTVVADEVG